MKYIISLFIGLLCYVSYSQDDVYSVVNNSWKVENGDATKFTIKSVWINKDKDQTILVCDHEVLVRKIDFFKFSHWSKNAKLVAGEYEAKILGLGDSDWNPNPQFCNGKGWGWSDVKRGDVLRLGVVFDGAIPPGLTKLSLEDNNSYCHGYTFSQMTFENPDVHPKGSDNGKSFKNQGKKYFESNIRNIINDNVTKGDLFVGIYEIYGSTQEKLALIPKDNADLNMEYDLLYIDSNDKSDSWWNPGDVKARLTPTATMGMFKAVWYDKNKMINNNAYVSFQNGVMSTIISGVEGISVKLFPFNNIANTSNDNSPSSKKNEWSGNGSGIIISESGYIITNHHVIEDADDIEVEFILDDEVQKFNAEIVQVDKVNDLAIIKIVDVNFDGVKEIPYNFNTRSSDVGTKVYAYGYPMALSLMGKEIKITDGIISSKSGFDGDITTYQITAPIQGGNSGGPLFDDKGNFIGINSSGLRKDVADNVGYTIKSNYVLNLLDVLPTSIDLPSNTKLESLPLTEQIKEISKYVVLVKVK